MAATLADPFQQNPTLWHPSETVQVRPASISTGFGTLDRELPGGGWPRGSLAEILNPRQDMGELSLLTPALARLSQSGQWIAFINPLGASCAPALATGGVDLSHVVTVLTRSERETQWSAEQALRAGSCAMVLTWFTRMTERNLRRLLRAAEDGESFGALIVPESTHCTYSAPLQLRLSPGRTGLTVHILKRQFGDTISVLELDTRRDSSSCSIRSRLPAAVVGVAS
jgi:cell division inhibitor SulA/protein ImuA